MAELPDLVSCDPPDIKAISRHFNGLLTSAVEQVNIEFGPRQLSKLPRDVEPLPTDTRQLSAYRTRIGTMLEYAISTEMERLLRQRHGDQYLLTFVTSHQYPDFYVRDDTLVVLLRIEMKAVDADSDEQAARFSTPTAMIDDQRDMLLLVAWEWQDLAETSGEVIGENPHIFASLILPAGEVAIERDIRLERTGGKIEADGVYVYSQKQDKYVPDPGNYGKLWRIVDGPRRDSPDLSESMCEFMRFLTLVDEHSPRNRLQHLDADSQEGGADQASLF